MSPSQNLVNFVSVMCESVLVGAYAVLIGFVIWILKRSWRSLLMAHRVLFGASIAMFLVSVAHLGLFMEQVTLPVLSLPNSRTQTVLWVFQFITCDLIIIWRVWVIWSRRYLVVLAPLAIMVLATGFSLSSVALPEKQTFFMTATIASVVANTSICTILIAGRIWYMQYRLRKSGGVPAYSSSYKGAALIVIESGSLYTLAQLIILILIRTGSVGLPVMVSLEMPLIGILPTLIILFVYFKMVPGDETPVTWRQNELRNVPQTSHTTAGTYLSARENGMEDKSGTNTTTSQEYNLNIQVKTEVYHAV